MTRLRIFLIFAALLALATAFTACGDSESSSSDESPQQVLDNATLEGVESGDLDVSLGVDIKGSEGGNLDISLGGPFQSKGGSQVPELDLSVKAEGSVDDENLDFEGSLVLLPGKAFVGYDGTDYAVDSTTYSFVEAAIQQAQNESDSGNQSADVTACQEAAAGIEIGNFVDNLSNDGSADVDGASTTKVSGDLDVPGAIDAVVELTEDPACKAQLGAAGPLPSGSDLEDAKSTVESMVKSAHVDVYVGEDNIIRRVSAQLAIDAPEGEDEGAESVNLDFDMSLTGVNEEQSISAPEGTKPLSDLFIKLGVNPLELAGALQGEGGLTGPGGIGSLLEGLGGSSGGSSGGGSSGGGQAAYLECLGEASTPVDLQRCAKLLQ